LKQQQVLFFQMSAVITGPQNNKKMRVVTDAKQHHKRRLWEQKVKSQRQKQWTEQIVIKHQAIRPHPFNWCHLAEDCKRTVIHLINLCVEQILT